ncbi:sulfatase family protein [Marinoscillum furvescens]|uniref:Arylsulfatase A-like enzyme n=1 Tax=Marinoscillum furvescens DSM 4134 TaxID=1122208 RepID=A0A3D9KZL2_MARFU|nr:sulfatase [Marinoscillum furvescens]RED96000.1 arylsulfatase A-like enzyme [Marinoscillum furvescens DSM 4134]
MSCKTMGKWMVLVCLVCLQWSVSAQERPNIVWIVSEDNSKHYLKLFDDNGVETPHIEKLAQQGVKFTRAFSNGAVCSVARSAIISGCYGPRTGTQFHRHQEPAPMPDGVEMFPAYLRKAGYYTANNAKEDYNFVKGDNVWDESSKKASWKNRGANQPFFYVHNIGTTHESRLHFSKEDMQQPTKVNPDAYQVQPNHPDTELFRYTNAYYRDKIQQMDAQLGEVVEKLEADGLLDDTFIFYYGDHGGVLPGSKGYIYETGLHVPMVVYVPKKYQHLVAAPTGGETDAFVSFVDLGPTVLHLAGVEVPAGMDGKPFLGKAVSAKKLAKRNITYGYADRFDEKYDLVRSVRKGKYKYIRSYQPFTIDGLQNNYRYKQLAYEEWRSLYLDGKLDHAQTAFFEPRPAEMLFDVEEDPYETKNLAKDPQFAKTLRDLRDELHEWVTSMPDLSFYPEHVLLSDALTDPVTFGKQNKKQIQRYLAIADLMLQPFDQVQSRLAKALASEDPWERYWALIACSTFGTDAELFYDQAETMQQTDPELLNRIRAAEFLAVAKGQNPEKAMTEALCKSENPTEALLMLNTITLMNSAPYGFAVRVEASRLNPVVRDDNQVKWRLEYLTH